MRLTEALEHMPESQRRAILLREWQGLSYHEIADELKLSQSAVETLIFRARRTLASNLESEAKQPGALSRMRKALDGGMLLAAIKGLLRGRRSREGRCRRGRRLGHRRRRDRDRSAPTSKPAPQKQAQVVQAVAPAAPVVFERARPSRVAAGRRPTPATAEARALADARARCRRRGELEAPLEPPPAPARSAPETAEGEGRAQGNSAGPGEDSTSPRPGRTATQASEKAKQPEPNGASDAVAGARAGRADAGAARHCPWRPTRPRATARATAKRTERARRSNGRPENRGLH